MLELARTVVSLLESPSPIVHLPLPADDPTRRRPDITLARQALGWEPTTSLEEGLTRTVAFLADEVGVTLGELPGSTRDR